MHIQSTNISQPKTILWHDKEVSTGIFKIPTTKAIYLGKHKVTDDYVADTKVHGGRYKACYLFSSDHYSYWKTLYPNLTWNWGMFGENLTINGMNETQIMVGDIYKIGDALVQVTQPREPCFKFGVKFGTQDVLKQFIHHGLPGTYIQILEEGFVKTGDELKLVERFDKTLSVAQLFEQIFTKSKNQELLKTAVDLDVLPLRKREKLKSFIQ